MTIALWIPLAVLALIGLVVSFFAKGKPQSYAIYAFLVLGILAIYFYLRPVVFTLP